MADTSVQHEVENWVRSEWLPREFGQSFQLRKLRLTSGGVFEFDAVSSDERVVALISTSALMTSGGKKGAAKVHKLRSDILFLTMLPNEVQRLVVTTAACMHAELNRESRNGRLPTNIVVRHADRMPPALEARLIASQQTASREVRPSRPGVVG